MMIAIMLIEVSCGPGWHLLTEALAFA